MTFSWYARASAGRALTALARGVALSTVLDSDERSMVGVDERETTLGIFGLRLVMPALPNAEFEFAQWLKDR